MWRAYSRTFTGRTTLSIQEWKKLVRKNGIALLDFLYGDDEAKAFEDRDFAALHLSTLRKVDAIANISLRAHDRKLKTNTTWWGMRGGRLVALLKWIGERPLYAFLSILFGVLGCCIGSDRVVLITNTRGRF